MITRRILLVIMLVGVAGALPALAANDQAVLVLHALPYDSRQSCSNSAIANFDCRSSATVSVGGAQTIDAVLMIYDFDAVAGVQCIFDWPAGWVFQGWRGGCVGNQIVVLSPTSDTNRDLVTAFDVISRPARVAVVGWLTMTTGPADCLQIGESGHPHGTHIVSGEAQQSETQIPLERRGSICNGQGGVDGCTLGTTMTNSTWGAIKTGF